MLLVLVGVELDAVRSLLVGEATQTLSCLCVPQLDVAVIATAEELSPIVVEADVTHCLHMP